MSDVTTPPLEVQAFYSTLTGMLIREDGKTRPVTLDEVEKTFGQSSLEDVLAMPGHWHDLRVPALRCRCWSHPRGQWVAIILPRVGKVQVSIDKAVSDRAVLVIFNKVLEAAMLARRNVWKRDGSDKAYVELTEAELNLVAASTLRPITRAVRHISIAAFNPPDRPAA